MRRAGHERRTLADALIVHGGDVARIDLAVDDSESTLSKPLYTAPMTVRILTSGFYIMTRVSRTAYWVLVVSSILASAFTATAQINPDLYAGLSWRNVGPFHGGRIAFVTRAISQPGVFYAGMPLGGIWKTTSAGVTWFPIFDQEKSVDSVGAIQVAPSNPDIVY